MMIPCPSPFSVCLPAISLLIFMYYFTVLSLYLTLLLPTGSRRGDVPVARPQLPS